MKIYDCITYFNEKTLCYEYNSIYNNVDNYVEIVLTLVRNSILINYYLQETGDFI